MSSCSSRPLSANEFWEMVSEIRPPLGCIGSRRLQKRDARVKRGLHKDKSSPVKLRLFTGDNDKRKLDETRMSRGSDYAPSRSPSHRNCHLSPLSADTRVKEEEEEKSRCALRKAREKVCARPY
ncbi:hypothetical protein Q8A67_022274 [Cirrhinus molitorella]|uniref:Uncharacterized protein n=1 Tax=Cirrhinus molitorella TaxID=172907 RepID=A0AA88P1J8_9TELE|nr:hypothetical protein Q8A67_022274 [Cirrhinus molitorella]